MTTLAIVDDDKGYRETLGDLISGPFDTRPLDGPFGSKDELVRAIRNGHNGALCDYQLTTRNYAPCSGAEAVAQLYDASFPAILVTRFKNSDIEIVRKYRRKIPVVLNNSEVDEKTVREGLRVCTQEFKNEFETTRRPWPTLVEVIDVDPPGSHAFVKAFVPAWRPDEGIRFPLDMLPTELARGVKPGSYLMAEANLGAETQVDLYLDKFSLPRKAVAKHA